MNEAYNPFIERPGIAPIKTKRDAALAARIECIGRLADRHKQYYADGDYWKLIELSYDYDRMKYMHKTAALIRAEAGTINRRVTDGTEISQGQ